MHEGKNMGIMVTLKKPTPESRPPLRRYRTRKPPGWMSTCGLSRCVNTHAGLGTFPIRFPSTEDPGDAGWHIDGSYYGGQELYMNLWSRERALLMLFLFSDVGLDDLLAFYYDDQSLETISQHAEAPVGTIKRRLHVARQRLRQELAWVVGSEPLHAALVQPEGTAQRSQGALRSHTGRRVLQSHPPAPGA